MAAKGEWCFRHWWQSISGDKRGVVLPPLVTESSGDRREVVLPPLVAESKWRQKGSGASATGGRV